MVLERVSQDVVDHIFRSSVQKRIQTIKSSKVSQLVKIKSVLFVTTLPSYFMTGAVAPPWVKDKWVKGGATLVVSGLTLEILPKFRKREPSVGNALGVVKQKNSRVTTSFFSIFKPIIKSNIKIIWNTYNI